MTIEDINDPKWAEFDKYKLAKKQQTNGSGMEGMENLDSKILDSGWEASTVTLYRKQFKSIITVYITFTILKKFMLDQNGAKDWYMIESEIYTKNRRYNPKDSSSEKYIARKKDVPFKTTDASEAKAYLSTLIQAYDKRWGERDE